MGRPRRLHNPSLHHLAAQLASGIGLGVDVCIPFACEQVGRLGLGKRCRPLDGTLHGLERQHDSGILALLARTMKVSAESWPGQIRVSNGPGQNSCLGIELSLGLSRGRAGVRWNFVGTLQVCLQGNRLGMCRRNAVRKSHK